MGIYWLEDDRWKRHGSELSECFGRLARGEMTIDELPAYRFQTPWNETLQGFLPFMDHWDWMEPALSRSRQARPSSLPASAAGG